MALHHLQQLFCFFSSEYLLRHGSSIALRRPTSPSPLAARSRGHTTRRGRIGLRGGGLGRLVHIARVLQRLLPPNTGKILTLDGFLLIDVIGRHAVRIFIAVLIRKLLCLFLIERSRLRRRNSRWHAGCARDRRFLACFLFLDLLVIMHCFDICRLVVATTGAHLAHQATQHAFRPGSPLTRPPIGNLLSSLLGSLAKRRRCQGPQPTRTRRPGLIGGLVCCTWFTRPKTLRLHEALVVFVEALICLPVCDLAIRHASEHLPVDLGVVLGHKVPDIVVEGRCQGVGHAVLTDVWTA